MEFRTAEDINAFFNDNGIFLLQENSGFQFVFKTGVDPKNFLRLLSDEEAKIANFVISNTINPYIDFSNGNVRQYATRINLDIINDYLDEQEQIDKLQALHDKLMDCKYISVAGQCYQLKYKGKIGLWLIDKGLIPITDLTEINEKINVVEKALRFNDATNQFSEAYELEIEKFDDISISDFKKA